MLTVSEKCLVFLRGGQWLKFYRLFMKVFTVIFSLVSAFSQKNKT